MTGDTEPDDNSGSHRRDAASPCLKDINAVVRAVDVATSSLTPSRRSQH